MHRFYPAKQPCRSMTNLGRPLVYDTSFWLHVREWERKTLTLCILQTFCRQFLWHELMLWPEDMPQRSVISCSANDDLVPSHLVGAHLKAAKSPAKFMLHPTAAHGGIFLDKGYQRRLISHISNFVNERSPSKHHTKRRSSTSWASCWVCGRFRGMIEHWSTPALNFTFPFFEWI